jgi:hypothetical protein
MNIESLIEKLNLFKNRKSMFIKPVDVTTAENFLTGYRFGYTVAIGWSTNDPWQEIWRESHRERGWKFGPVGSVPYMKEAGLNIDETINELIEIEITFLRKLKAVIEQKH